MNEVTRHILAFIAGAILTPLLMGFFARLFPIRSTLKRDFTNYEQLKKRNNWIDLVGCGLFFVAIWSAVLLYMTVLDENDPWGIGFGFGMSVLAPVLWSSAVTLPSGFSRFREFWTFYEQKYKIGAKGITLIYTPLCLLGIVSSVVLIRRFF